MTEMFLPVRPGTPMPEIDRTSKGARRKYPIDTLEPGTAFFVPERTSKSISAYISRISKDAAGKFSARHAWGVKAATEGVWDIVPEGTSNAVEGVSVWRLTDDEIAATAARAKEREKKRAGKRAKGTGRGKPSDRQLPG